MRVFLTGGAGFIGSHLCDALIAQGDTPVILDNLSTGQLSNIAHIQNKVEIHQGDIRDAVLVNKLTEQSDLVLHMAAALGVSTILEKTVESVSTNFTGYKEVLEGLMILRSHSDALRGILSIGIQRGGITALTLMALLLERNSFNDPADPDAGLAGFGMALAIAGIGIGLGAIISPYGVIKFGRHRWMRLLMFLCIPPLLIYAAGINEISMIGSAFLVGLCGQGIKVTNDALVQSKITDEYRGRVFAFYDVAVNAGIVTGAIGAALILPDNGVTAFLPITVALFYLFAATVLMRRANFAPSTT